jgi:RNA polymerase sigma factor (sigma-70 family)
VEASALPASVGLGRTRIAIGGPLLRIRSDEQLVTLFREGNDEAFRVIHDRYRARLFVYTRQMLGRTAQDPEDAVQEIFMRAYYGLRASDRRLALKPWLYRIAHNRCVDDLRRPLPIAIEGVETLVPCIQDPAVRVEQREVLRRLISDVQRLPEQQRSALLMRELSGMAYAEVSGALGVSVPAVKSLLVRARIGLAQAGEARNTACAEIRDDVILSVDRGVRTSGLARRHMRDCKSCREFRSEVRGVSRQLAALAPTLGPIGVIANLLGWGGGGGAAAGSGAVAGGGAAAAGGAAGGGAAASAGVLVSGASHVVTLLAAAVVTAGGAVELQTSLSARAHARVHHHHAAAFAAPGPTTRSAGDGAVIATSAMDSASVSSAAPSVTATASGSKSSTRGAARAAASRKASSHASSTSTVPISETLDPDNMIYSTGGASPAPGSTQGTATGTASASSTGAATGTESTNTTVTGTDNAGATGTGTGSGSSSAGTTAAGSGTGTGTGSDTGAGTGSATGAGTGTGDQSTSGDTTASGSGGAAGTAPQ